MNLPIIRKRAEGLSRAVEAIRESWGDVGTMLIDSYGMEPEIKLGEALMVTEDVEGIAFAPWEVLMLLETLAKRYEDETLGKAEGGALE